MNEFFTNYGLIILLVVLLVFMFWSSRRRMAKQKLEQEERARNTVPGAEVLLQGGLYGTIVSYDPENLDQPAVVEIAPGVDIKVHSQAILRVVTATVEQPTEDDFVPTTSPADDVVVEPAPLVSDDVADGPANADSDPDSDSGTKPQA
ncbi:preprotein translocase subunit YajC [Microbacterium sp. CFH 31415]|uniref:preprotein translocase subunit YajC n=1 Tax=Microbacterium sp. CFH 31415 TaxID=2921732 RepID=UPI001F148F19|nr:preprotein translocase subunit YajC [Microbacterium sp. CFH 31415]MCH6229602.1 preprotein translocase subunit YajC [Microbacterium sp. CFH 31415]